MGANAIVMRTAELGNLMQAVTKALAEGPITLDEVNPAELAAICDEFLEEGVHQSRRLAGEVQHGLNVTAAKRLTHRWAGTGGTLGFPQISQLAFDIERLLDQQGASASELEQRLRELVYLFERAFKAHKNGSVPDWAAEMLKGRRIGLVGFESWQITNIVKAIEVAGGAVTILPEGKPPDVTSEDMWIVSTTARGIASTLGSDARVLFAGGPDLLRQQLADVALIHDILVEPWTAEEVVTRCRRLLTASASPTPETPKNDPNKAVQVLIADDDPTIVAIVRSTFEGHGMKCASTNNGGDVVPSAEKLTPDVIVLDVNLPQMDGFQVLSTIRNHKLLSRCLVVLLTARQQETDIMKGFGLGADDYILKPFSPMELVARVRRLLHRR
jgi:CheY-like chemotaxis protein/HPt (histidine-containing phosphotransfer) domain-containing protein